MDLVTVRKSDYSISKLVEGFSTLVWSERYLEWGDFELHSEDVVYTMNLLPERSLCTLRDSNEIMMVDSHEISTSSEGVPELIVKGRTVDSFLENRVWKNAPYGKSVKMAESYNTKEAAAVWLWNAIINDTEFDVIKLAQPNNESNVLPNTVVTVSMPEDANEGLVAKRKVENGEVYEQLITFLSSAKLGIRTIRPNNTKGRVVSVDSDGVYSTDFVSDITSLRFDIYKGRDLTEKVIFSWKAGHLDDPKYMLSSYSLKTGAYVMGDDGENYYTDTDALPGNNDGWNRRDVFVDGGSKETGEDAGEFAESLMDLGLRAVRKEGNHINTIDATISPFINFKYNVDYRLGDMVRVQGQYGSDNKFVTEFIRTQDGNGEVGYPTLVAEDFSYAGGE